jgi:hypothetical protein
MNRLFSSTALTEHERMVLHFCTCVLYMCSATADNECEYNACVITYCIVSNNNTCQHILYCQY